MLEFVDFDIVGLDIILFKMHARMHFSSSQSHDQDLTSNLLAVFTS